MRARHSAQHSTHLSALLNDDMYYGGDDEDHVVDFTNAVLYVGAEQREAALALRVQEGSRFVGD